MHYMHAVTQSLHKYYEVGIIIIPILLTRYWVTEQFNDLSYQLLSAKAGIWIHDSYPLYKVSYNTQVFNASKMCIMTY